MSVMPRILAVIVIYWPDPAVLSRLLRTLAPQVAGGILVNNGGDLPLSAELLQETGFSVQGLPSNLGVATALNAGFAWAERQDAEFVITFDQDSEPAPDMVARLLSACQDLMAAGHQVGAVGPKLIDSRTGRHVSFLKPVEGWRQRVVLTAHQVVEVDHLITSGCLVPMAVWQNAGGFLDALFIDYVDIEWCLRLRHAGWHFFGVGGATLSHAIGDDVKHWCGREVAWHSPLRHYYMLRNGLYLQKLPHISRGWKMVDALVMLRRLVFYTLVARPRWTHLRAMLYGVRDGWRGRLGAADYPD